MFAALVAVTLAAPAAPEEKEKDLPEAAKKELTKFEGKWRATKLVVNETDVPPPEDNGGVVEFKGRKVLLGGEDLYEVAALDPSTDPKCLDLKAVVDKGAATKGTVYETIYKFDGDELTIAMHLGPEAKRPGKFEAPKDSGVVVVTLKREKN